MKKGFILYKWMYKPIKDLSDEKFWKLMKAIFEYQENWIENNLDDDLKMAFLFFKNQFDIDNEKYEAICDKRREQGKKWGLAKASKSYQVLPKPSKSSLKDKDKDKDIYTKLENLVEKWNLLKDKDKFWKKTIKINDNLKDIYKKIDKQYTQEEIVLWVRNYLKEIKSRDINIDYSQHRFTLYDFLKQWNWLNKFINN